MKALLMSLTMSFGFLAVVAHAQAPASAPAGSTGLCKDGSYYSGDSKKGACRGHKGVKEWYGGAAADAGAAPSKTKASRKAKADDAVAAAPAAPTAKPADATGLCKDGSYTTGDSKKGACRGHKGVKEWYAAAAPAASADAGAMKTASRTARDDSAGTAAPASAPAGSTGLCKDGTYYNGDSKKGACRGHKGVKEWYGAAAAAPAAPSMPPPAPKLAPAPAPMPVPAPSATPAATHAPTPPPAPETRTAAAGGGNGKVWLNTETKVYHCPNDRYYGKTKQGEYLSEADAIAKGAHGSHGKGCTQ